jgi:preprotein translocase subunit SecB
MKVDQQNDIGDLIREVAQRISINSINLVATNAIFDEAKGPLPDDADVSVNHRYRVDSESNAIVVEIDFKMESGKCLAIMVTYQIEYRAKSLEGLEDKHFKAFAQFNGMYNLWPYIREYVQSLVGKMGLPPIVLPVMTVPSGFSSKPSLGNDEVDSG